jgi:hypothetical protein
MQFKTGSHQAVLLQYDMPEASIPASVSDDEIWYQDDKSDFRALRMSFSTASPRKIHVAKMRRV